MRVAVTGAGGRLGRALVAALADAPFTGPARPDRLDARGLRPRRPGRRSRRCSTATGPRPSSTRRPGPTSTAAPGSRSWRCRRNAEAVGVLAEATAAARRRPGPRQHERGLRRDDGPTGAATRRTTRRARSTPYGASKLGGESAAARRPRAAAPRGLGIVRTAWLYGPPGNDFPAKILAAAERARAAGEPLRVVGDEFGSPTFTHDVAEAIVGAARVGRRRRRPPRRQRRASRHAPAGRVSCSARPGWTSRSRRCRPRRGSAPRHRRPGASSPRRRCPGGEPLRPGRRRSPTTCRRCCRAGAAGDASGRRRCPACASGGVVRHARQPRLVPRAVARVVVPGPDASRRPVRRAGADAAVRPGQPLDVGCRRAPRPPLPPPPARLLDRGLGPGARRARRRAARSPRGRRAGARSRPTSWPPTTGS